MLRKAIVAAVACAGALLTGCDLEHEVRAVDSQRFAVAKANLITPNIPWLPSSQRDGLMFLLNPSDPPTKQVFVLLDDRDQACAGRDGGAYMRSLCDGIGNSRFRGIGDENSLLRVPAPPNNIGVLYVRRDDPTVYVAQCIESRGIDGMCHSVGAYRATHFTIRFPEKSIRELPALVAEAHRLLQSWEVGGERPPLGAD